jgi:hypothetical protein
MQHIAKGARANHGVLTSFARTTKTPKARKQGKREVIMDKKNTIIGIVAVVIVLAIIGWASGWFGGQAPQDAMAPATTTEQPAAPATTTEQPATPAPATTPPATTTTQ